MNRSSLFMLAAAAAVVFVIVAIVYFVGGSPLGHHIKHGILFLGLALISGLFAAANRPTAAVR
jgi:hypothetical protein